MIDQPIAVTVADDGEPRSFTWGPYEYEVVGVPQNFFRRRKWWQEAGDLTTVDQKLWRVEASCDSSEFRLYDLLCRPSGQWFLYVQWE
ncbi:hypothetical protein FCK90_09110 [Kocuria coralli]|uniref:DUF6504 domain-containing protein n=1 Tax=Kocuria coralli TaxID=1461025 RepID=A0A5J5KXB8_9MICC|nr:DUF6504 family protein [Kocuria coralli]KAA9394058.1 hypothetical protein FCK90_09110 [Kocuria coralli]